MSSANDRKAKIQAAAPKDTGNRIVVAGVVIALAILAVVGGVIFASTRGGEAGDQTPPATAMGEGFVVNRDVELVDGAPTVEIYEDFRCPACKIMEDAFGKTVEDLADEGKIKLVYHLKTVIDSNSGGDNSQRAASNALCAADQGKWREYHDQLFQNQSREYTTAQFTEFAEAAGLTGQALEDWKSCSQANEYGKYVASVDEATFKAGIRGTPVLVVNGTKVSWGTFLDQTGQPLPGSVDQMADILESGEVPEDRVDSE